MKVTAAQVENAIVEFIHYRGGWARVVHTTGIPLAVKGKIIRWKKNPKMKGMADLYVMEKGITTRVEVKRPGDKENDDQKRDRERWEAAGGPSLIVSDIDDFLNQYGEL